MCGFRFSVLSSVSLQYIVLCPHIFFFYYLVYEAIGTAATLGLLCQPRVLVKMIVEKEMECRLAGETEVLGENLPQRHFYPSQNLTWPDPGLNPGRRGGKPATNRLNYGAALCPHNSRSWKFTVSLRIYLIPLAIFPNLLPLLLLLSPLLYVLNFSYCYLFFFF
jgi:hypothetical protein